MFIILDNNFPVYVTGIEEVASKYCETENLKNKTTSFKYNEIGTLGAMDKDCSGLNPLVEFTPSCEITEAWEPTITPEQKQYILNTLGFTGRGKGLWYHKSLGADVPTNRFHFNLGDGELSRIPSYLIQEGIAQLKNAVKELLTL